MTTREGRATALDRIIADVVRPGANDVDRHGGFPTASIDALRDAGLLSLTIPTLIGGSGASADEVRDIVTRLAQACASTAMVYVMHLTSLNSIIPLQDQSRRDSLLQQIVDKGWLVSEAISEPGSGSQWWSVSSIAEEIPTGYRITADKSFCTSAGHADLYVVSTRTPRSESDRDHAIFVVRADDGEVESGQWNGLGLAGNSSTWIRFRSEVGREALLYSGADGAGLRYYNEVNQPIYHLGVSAAYVGIARAAYQACVDRIRSRRYQGNPAGFGSALGDYPVARRHVGQMAVRLLAAEAMVLQLAQRIDAGESLDEISLLMTATKVGTAEAASAVAREAMMASGGVAYSRGPLTIERHLRDALAASLMGPNDDFCKELMGRLEIDDGSYHDL